MVTRRGAITISSVGHDDEETLVETRTPMEKLRLSNQSLEANFLTLQERH